MQKYKWAYVILEESSHVEQDFPHRLQLLEDQGWEIFAITHRGNGGLTVFYTVILRRPRT